MGDSWNRKLTHQLYTFMYILLFHQYPVTVDMFLNEQFGLSLNLWPELLTNWYSLWHMTNKSRRVICRKEGRFVVHIHYIHCHSSSGRLSYGCTRVNSMDNYIIVRTSCFKFKAGIRWDSDLTRSKRQKTNRVLTKINDFRAASTHSLIRWRERQQILLKSLTLVLCSIMSQKTMIFIATTTRNSPDLTCA